MTSLRRIQAKFFEENVENRVTTTNSLPLASSSVHAGIHSDFDGFCEQITIREDRKVASIYLLQTSRCYRIFQ